MWNPYWDPRTDKEQKEQVGHLQPTKEWTTKILIYQYYYWSINNTSVMLIIGKAAIDRNSTIFLLYFCISVKLNVSFFKKPESSVKHFCPEVDKMLELENCWTQESQSFPSNAVCMNEIPKEFIKDYISNNTHINKISIFIISAI